jgi:FKBP-type peptidyl-prolyl cis-trans isomerase FkpA
MKRLSGSLILAAMCIVLIPGCDDPDPGTELKVSTHEGFVIMKYEDLVVGTGEAVKPLDKVEVHYTGWLRDGRKFDSSLDANKPYIFTVGREEVIKGWDEGLVGMKVGGKRKLYVPAKLGYGTRGYPGTIIGPNARLIFEVELLHINKK